jgi:diguanylate cyclase (GGDEF)-like protein/PAS domain S-box-containing protein
MTRKPSYETLEARVKELETSARTHRNAEDALRKLTHDLADRIKKLNCLYGISKLRENQELPLERIYQGIIDLIPPAWQYPEITCARVIIEGQEFRTERFGESVWKQSSDIFVSGARSGALEVFYAEERPECDEGPFLQEERKLLNIIAERLGRIIEHRCAKTALWESEKECLNLFANAPIGIFRSTVEGKLLSANPACAQMFGYENSVDILASVHDLATDLYLDPRQREALLQRVMEGDAVLGFENAYRRKDGSTFIGNIHLRVARNKEGAPQYLEDFIEDITERKDAENAIKESEALLQGIFDAIQDGISLLDKDLNVLRVNKTMEKWYAHTMPFTGRKCYEVYHRRSKPCKACPALKALKTRSLQMNVVPLPESQETVGWLELYAFPVLDSDGRPQGVVEYVRNVTDRMNAEQALRESEERFRATFEQAAMGICHLDEDGTFLRVNRRFCDMLGYTREELVGRTFREITNPDDLAASIACMQQALSGKIMRCDYEKRYLRKDGSEMWANVTVALVRGASGKPRYFIYAVEDISERKQMEQELRRLATTDPLTGVFNRRHFLDLGEKELSRACRYGRELSVLLMDIDHFKCINDTYGHAVGDETIKTLTHICLKNLRKNDFFGRLGGEEFAVVLPETGADVAIALAERLRQKLSEARVSTDKKPIGFTVSIGVTTFNEEDRTIEAMMLRADAALYRAKNRGRNRVDAG